MTELEQLKHQRDAIVKAIDAIGKLNDQGLTMSYDTDKLSIARQANKSAFWEINNLIHELERRL